jgi:hypothetical protein
MSRLLFRCLVAPSLGGAWIVSASAAAPEPDFDKDVRPILAENCLECHSLDKAKGGLSLVSLQDAVKVLKSGVPALVPGKPEESELIKRVASTHEDEIMPPGDKKPLTPKQVETLRQWIASGADWPAHWAYRPVGKSEKLKVSQKGGDSPIDGFVLEKLAQANISPSPEADRTRSSGACGMTFWACRRLLRRSMPL